MKIDAAIAKSKDMPLVIEEIELDEPKENEVLVKIIASGICHTDAESIKGHGAPFPAVLGHEGAGIVEKVGRNVTDIAIGDHVILSYSYCNNCSQCLDGRHNLCVRTVELNFGGKMQDRTYRLHKDNQDYSTFFGQSSFSTYAVANKNNIVKVDKDIDLRLLGPLGCGIQTGSGTVMNSLHPEPGSSIAIFGAGAVGLSAVMAANLLGLKNIIVVDIHESRLELAKELGATHAFNSSNVDITTEIKQSTQGGVNYAIETTGVPVVIKQAIDSLRLAGKISIVGMGGDVTLNFTNDILMEGKTIVGTIQGDSTPQIHIPKIIEYFKAGKFPFDKLIKFYDFKDINQAFDDAKVGKTIKPVVLIEKSF